MRRTLLTCWPWLLFLTAAILLPAQVPLSDPSSPDLSRTFQTEVPPGGAWQPPVFRFQRGDDPGWSARDLDDSGWPTIAPNRLPPTDGVYWVRFRLETAAASEAAPILDGLAVTVLASYDLYWDGRLIGRNGVVGRDAAEEQPGAIDTLFQIPADLAGPGSHVVALRLSSNRLGDAAPHHGVNVTRMNFASALVERTRHAMQTLVAVGGLAGFALAFALAWALVDRRPAVLLFASVALVAATIQALQAWRWLYDYPYTWHFPRMAAITALVAVLGGLIVAGVSWHARLPWRWSVLVAYAAYTIHAWLANPLYVRKSFWLFFPAMVLALAIASWAVARRQRHAWVLVLGLVVCFVWARLWPRDFAERSFVIAFGSILGGAFIALALQWRDERRAARQAQLTAARLEIELLKKHIQPHFLMNTLTALMEVVESDPRQAVSLIGALSDEFRILARVSAERLVTLDEELRLCDAHLKIMSLRHERPCTLEARNVDRTTLVPPGLFHTLIENSLTHQQATANGRRFQLRATRDGPRTRYEFLAPGAPRPARAQPSNDKHDASDSPGNGTGLRYVRARLEESFPGRWQLTSEPVSDGWRTIVEITASA